MSLDVGSWVEERPKRGRCRGGRCGVVVAVVGRASVRVLLVSPFHLCTTLQLHTFGEVVLRSRDLRSFKGTGSVGQEELKRLFAERLSKLEEETEEYKEDQSNSTHESVCFFNAPCLGEGADREGEDTHGETCMLASDDAPAIAEDAEQKDQDLSDSHHAPIADVEGNLAANMSELVHLRELPDNSREEEKGKQPIAVITNNCVLHRPENIKTCVEKDPLDTAGEGHCYAIRSSSIADLGTRSLECEATPSPKRQQISRESDESSPKEKRIRRMLDFPMFACQLRVQFFMKGKMKDIKGKGGSKNHFIGVSCETGVARIYTLGLTNNLRVPVNDIKQIHVTKDDPEKAQLVVDTSSMAFWVTINKADAATLSRLVDELRVYVATL
mmetsp:Transcript_3989/g.6469  ORF Transcript_3989/g.6469 Transcript_3989/m.6469 type:complete len:385 (+) Transcript_3989:39-1193(+)